MKLDADILQGYELVWYDEFDGTALDGKKWTLRSDMTGQTDLRLADESTPEVVKVTDSQLHLNAIQDGYLENGDPKYVTCYSVTTFDKMHFRYGYLEIRAKVPYKQGSWPSFWLKSMNGKISPRKTTDYMTEVDVFEVFASKNTAAPTIHKWYANNTHTQEGCTSCYVFKDSANLNNEYHVYGFKWTPEEMSMYIDGEKYYSFDITADYDGGGNMAGFQDPLYVIFNNHLFTSYSPWKPEGSEVNETSVLPMEYWIDYIHLYQKPGLGEIYTEK